MKIVKLETFLTNAGLRNYLFVRLTTDTGLSGLGEASLEWQEKTVETLIHEWVEDRILGVDPRDVKRIIADLIRDQYQGGSTVLTAISGVEVALWDILGKESGQPVYQLLGGRSRERLPSYANGWYGNAQGPAKSWRPVVPNTLLFDEEFGGFMGLIENFLEVVRKKAAPLVTGWDGHRAYELNVAALLSLHRQAPVSLPLSPAAADAERASVVQY